MGTGLLKMLVGSGQTAYSTASEEAALAALAVPEVLSVVVFLYIGRTEAKQ